MPLLTTEHEATTPDLTVAYEQTGPDTGPAVLLLHGWPYDPRCYDRVRDPLANAGYRVLVPYLRGFGPTRFRDPATLRSGQQAALGKDIVDLLDALGLPKATLVGYDWGGRGACVAAALWPDRVRGLVTSIGYAIHNRAEKAHTFDDIPMLRKTWYQWFLNTPMGGRGLDTNRDAIAAELWQEWSPRTPFDAVAFAATARSFRNPDWISVTLHSYRDRYENTPGDPRLEALEVTLAQTPAIPVPTLVLGGDSDGLYPADISTKHRHLFRASFDRHILPGVGHCPPADDPEAFVAVLLPFLAGLPV